MKKQKLIPTNIHYNFNGRPDSPIEGDMWVDSCHGYVIYVRNGSKFSVLSLKTMKFILSKEEIRAERLRTLTDQGIKYEDAILLVDDLLIFGI
mgnify:CR=1 FL=1|tara:strand:+ start:242 stop:520 length:279 start_codon:yes stop_codon:yes gene_type:complete